MAGLAFDAKGRRLAVAHYGGVTLWEQAKRGWKASRLLWHGSHRMVTVSPDGRFVVTAMQEPTLHGWRLRDKADMRMAGYPGRVKATAWVGDGAWLATAGADCAVCWPFDGPSGPMGRAPMLVAAREGVRCTAVAALPGAPWLLAGFADGAVVAAELIDDAPGRAIRTPPASPIVALAVDAEARTLLVAHEDGRLAHQELR